MLRKGVGYPDGVPRRDRVKVGYRGGETRFLETPPYSKVLRPGRGKNRIPAKNKLLLNSPY